MNKQTSIEWLVEQIKEDQTSIAKTASEWNLIFQQARDMHKEEIQDAYANGWHHNNEDNYNPIKYYQETFKGGNK